MRAEAGTFASRRHLDTHRPIFPRELLGRAGRRLVTRNPQPTGRPRLAHPPAASRVRPRARMDRQAEPTASRSRGSCCNTRRPGRDRRQAGRFDGGARHRQPEARRLVERDRLRHGMWPPRGEPAAQGEGQATEGRSGARHPRGRQPQTGEGTAGRRTRRSSCPGGIPRVHLLRRPTTKRGAKRTHH